MRMPLRRDRVLLLTAMAMMLSAVENSVAADMVPVHIRLLDAFSNKTTPAMICITGDDKKVRLPPDGRVLQQPSTTEEFASGISFQRDRNWVGPVRKMLGQGNNHDRSYVYQLRPSIPYWQEPVMYQVSGDFTIQLPPGRWRVAVEHGMEYVPVSEEFLVKPPGPVAKTFELKRWIDLTREGWWSGDVHVHHPSQKKEHRDFLLEYAKAEDLHVVNLLEVGHHDTDTTFKVEGFGHEHRINRDGYCLVSGQEEPRGTFGHIIGLNINSLVRDASKYHLYDLAFERIHQQPGALVGYAHFSWNGCNLPRGFPTFVTTGELDFIELLQFSHLNAVDYYKYLNLGFKLTAAAGSDTPWGSTIGEVRTYVHTGPQLDLDEWFAGLKKGHTFVSNGPALSFTVDGLLPGSELTKAAGETVVVKAKVRSHPAIGIPHSLILVSNEGVIGEVENPGKDAELTIELKQTVERSRWIAASTACANGAVAHSTPVYVIVDGHPTWSPTQGPDLVDEQLAAIEKIGAEFDPTAGEEARSIHERLNRARLFYTYLKTVMRRQAKTAAADVQTP